MAENVLKYVDEDDRAYGVAGMTIALVLWDGEPYLSAVSIDNPVGQSIEFNPNFGFAGNPRLMASLAWREHIKQFELTAAMVIANAMCRSYVRASAAMTAATGKALREFVRNEGRESCSLEEDETDILYNKTHRYLDRVFTHAAVTSLARDLADTLRTRRRLSASEVFEILSVLNHM